MAHMNFNRNDLASILGLGSIGTFTAHALATSAAFNPPPAINLLAHRSSAFQEFCEHRQQISFKTPENCIETSSGYDFEIKESDGTWTQLASSGSQIYSTCIEKPIEHLIVCVKATQTVSALESVKARLSRASTIVFLQNGCGMIDEVNDQLFAEPEHRPNT